MGYNPLNFGSPQNNDGERLKTAFTKVDEMLAEIFTILPGKQPANIFLSSLSALTGSGIVIRSGAGDAVLQALGGFGQTFLAAADAAAGRAALGLGQAAVLPVTGPGGVLVRGLDGKILSADLPPLAFDDLTDVPSVFPPAPHGHAFSDVSDVPLPLTQLAGLVGEGLLARSDAGVTLRTATSLGLGLVAAADAAAARAVLGLGAVAAADWDVDGGAPRISGGKISPALLPPINYDLDPQFPATEAARLALPETVPAGTLVFQQTPPGIFVVTDIPGQRFYNFTLPGSPVLSVFGMTGNVGLAALPALTGAVEDGDSLPILDASSGGHAKITRGGLLSMAAAPDGKAGLADGSAALLVANAAGTPSRVALVDWIASHAANTSPLDTDALLIGPLSGLPKRTTLAQLFNGRTLQNSRLIGVTETKQARVDIAGAVQMGTHQVGNTYHYRLTGNATLTPPARPAATNAALGITVIVEQDGTGGRTFGFTPPGGEQMVWSGGNAGSVNTPANSITVFSLMTWQGANFWLASKWV